MATLHSASSRVRFARVPRAEELLTSAFLDYFVPLHDALSPRLPVILSRRAEALGQAHRTADFRALDFLALPESDAEANEIWQVPPVPAALRQPGIEISGPCSIAPMFINALNPGPEGERAVGDLDDDEDSSGQRLVDTLAAAHNRMAAVRRELSFFDPERKKQYALAPGDPPFLIHRERGLHLFESELTIDGQPVSAALLGTALTLFYAGRAHVERGEGIFFYLPKMEFPDEAKLYRDLFDASRAALPFLKDATLRAIALVESLPCVYNMEAMLRALGPYAAGLNAARWDLKASLFEYVMTDARAVWPDRFGVDIKSTPFLGEIFRRLVAVCQRHGAVAIGGMATALPSQDLEVNRVAAEAIRKDKEWEAAQGFLRGWVAHIFHMKTAAEPFQKAFPDGSIVPAGFTGPADPSRHPVRIEVPQGPITLDGTRRNCRMVIEYLEGWLAGRGAKGIDSLDGQPGLHPALMEDLATFRMSVAQLAQRIRHRVATTAGPSAVHGFEAVKQLLQSELADILSRNRPTPEKAQRYHASLKIALRWIHNYVELNFRSLASYPRDELLGIAEAPDAF